MVWTSTPVEPPQWVISFPDALSPDVRGRIVEQAAAAIEAGSRVIVLEGGAQMYDARYGAPPVSTELEAVSTFDVPRWLVALLALLAVAQLALTGIALYLALRLATGG